MLGKYSGIIIREISSYSVNLKGKTIKILSKNFYILGAFYILKQKLFRYGVNSGQFRYQIHLTTSEFNVILKKLYRHGKRGSLEMTDYHPCKAG